MKAKFVCAAFTAALLCSTAAMAQLAAPGSSDDTNHKAEATKDSGPAPAGKVGKAVGVPLSAASTALTAKDYPTALAAVKQAQAVPNQTPFETYMINKFLSVIEINMHDLPAATPAAEAAADSPAMPPEEKKDVVRNALLLSTESKDYQKTIGYAQQLDQAGLLTDDVGNAMTAVAYYNLKDMAHAKQYAQRSIDASKAAGKTPDKNALAIVMNAEATNDPAAALQTLEQMAVQYNRPEDWDKLVGVSLGTKGLSNADALNMYRLLYLMGPMLTADDYTYASNLAEAERDSKEAAVILEAGVSSGKGSGGAALNKARSEASADERVLSAAAAAAAKSKRGEDSMQIAQDYWGYGRYADVEAAARAAQSKGGMKDPGEANVLIGMAQIAQGNYAGGQATLGQVSGSAGRMKTAHLWTLYAQAKQKGSAAAAPATPPPASH